MQLVSATAAGEPANGVAFADGISANGNVTLFSSSDTNLRPAGAPNWFHLFVRSGSSLTMVDAYPDGTPSGNGLAMGSALSDDGGWVAFHHAVQLVSAPGLGPVGGIEYVYRRSTRTLTPIAVNTGSEYACSSPRMIANGGTTVVFPSIEPLVAGDLNGRCDLYVWRASTGAVELVGYREPAFVPTYQPVARTLTPDGRFLVYTAQASESNRQAGASTDAFYVDLSTGTETAITVGGFVSDVDVSDDGQLVAYTDKAGMPTGDGGWTYRSLVLRTMSTGAEEELLFGFVGNIALSGDARFVATDADWTRFGGLRGLQGWGTAMVYDRQSGVAQLGSRVFGRAADQTDTGGTQSLLISGDGSRLLFTSTATDLLATPFATAQSRAYSYRVSKPTARVSLTLDIRNDAGGTLAPSDVSASVTGNGAVGFNAQTNQRSATVVAGTSVSVTAPTFASYARSLRCWIDGVSAVMPATLAEGQLLDCSLQYDDLAPLITPPGFTAGVSGVDRVSLSWTDVRDETGYDIERQTYDPVTFSWGAFVLVTTTTPDLTTWTETPAPGQYRYRVRSRRGATTSASTPMIMVTVPSTGDPLTPPLAPSAPTVGASAGGLLVGWTDNATNEAGFRIWRAVYDPMTRAFATPALVGSVGADVTTFVDNPPSGTYRYVVRALNAVGTSAPVTTAPVVAPSGEVVTRPAAPTGLSSSMQGPKVAVAWTDVSNNELGYDIYRATWNGASFGTPVLVGREPAGAVSFLDTPTAGRYRYSVRGWNAAGASGSPSALPITVP